MLRASPATESADQFTAGYSACAMEISRVVGACPSIEPQLGHAIIEQVSARLKNMQTPVAAPLSVAVPRPPLMPMSAEPLVRTVIKHSPLAPSDGGYSSGRDSVSPRAEEVNSAEAPLNFVKKEVEERRRNSSGSSISSESVWRPF